MTTQIVEPIPVKTIVNPFTATGAEVSTPTANNPLAATDQARAIAEVQAALVVARMNPRNPIVAMDCILNTCSRPSLANSATYAYNRGGNFVSGPSIRLAEALAQAWGNIQYGIRELSQKDGVSTVAAFAWDVETNTRREVVFQVALKRDTGNGSYQLTKNRDIYELVANQGARRLRSCILSVIPGDVTEAALQQCEATQRANVDMTAEGIKGLVETFAKFGVSKKQLEDRIQRRIDSILPAQVVNLRNIYRSLRDGVSTPEDWFAPETSVNASAKKGAAGLKDKLKKKAAVPAPSSTVETTATSSEAVAATQIAADDQPDARSDEPESVNPSADLFGAAPATGMPPAPPAEEDPWLTEMKAADAAQAAGD